MEDLKFVYQREEEVPAGPELPNIFSGRYKFATQTTAVYDACAFVRTGARMLQLPVKCVKAFAHGSRIGIVYEDRAEIYADGKLEKSIDGPVSDTEFYATLFEGAQGGPLATDGLLYASSYDAGKAVVCVYKDSVRVGSDKHVNSIHADGAEYFVAYCGDVLVVGNNMSDTFLYFVGGQQAWPEECDSPALCTDDDCNIVFADDAKFHGGVLLLRNAGKNCYYELEGAKEPAAETIIECELTDGEIVEKGPVAFSAEAGIGDVSIADINMALPAEEADPEAVPMLVADAAPPSFASLMKQAGLQTDSGTDSEFGTGKLEEHSPPKPLPKPESKNDVMLTKVGGFSFGSLKPLTNPSAAAPSASGSAKSERSTAKPATSEAGGATESLFEGVQTPSSVKAPSSSKAPAAAQDDDMKDGMSREQKRNIEALRQDLQGRMQALNESYSRMGASHRTEIPKLELIVPSLDCAQAYNAVHNSTVAGFNTVLTQMISKLQILRAFDSRNVSESIRFFDARILDKTACMPCVHYQSALAPRVPSAGRRAPNDYDALLESVKLISVSKVSERRPEEPKAASSARAGPSSISTPAAGSTAAPPSKAVPPAASFSAPPPSNAPNPTPAQPAASNASFGTAVPNLFAVKPSEAPAQQLFNSAQFAHPMRVSDTTSLFNNLSQSGPSGFNAPQQPSPGPQDNAGAAGGSAFSRLAGSRRMFP
ncbi:hypothetical protein PAPHI01_0989 [Pancytospora philotis]|nr:hypothetical protein PAPHI01_0989 [Pancytospora philotis]